MASSGTFLLLPHLPPTSFRHEPRRWSVTLSKFSKLLNLQYVLWFIYKMLGHSGGSLCKVNSVSMQIHDECL